MNKLSNRVFYILHTSGILIVAIQHYTVICWHFKILLGIYRLSVHNFKILKNDSTTESINIQDSNHAHRLSPSVSPFLIRISSFSDIMDRLFEISLKGVVAIPNMN